MEHTNFDGLSDEEFRQLEKAAWKGQLDYSGFPAPEYKLFDTVATLGYRHRHEKIPAELLEKDISLARRTYRKESEQLRYSKTVWAERSRHILLTDELRCSITKTDDPSEKLQLALRCIELMTGEKGFEERNKIWDI